MYISFEIYQSSLIYYGRFLESVSYIFYSLCIRGEINQFLILSSASMQSCMVTAKEWHGCVLKGLTVYWTNIQATTTLTQWYQHSVTSDILKFSTEFDDIVKARKV